MPYLLRFRGFLVGAPRSRLPSLLQVTAEVVDALAAKFQDLQACGSITFTFMESLCIYGLVIALAILFANPFA